MGRIDLPDPIRDEDIYPMKLVSANEATRTYDCRVPLCERPAETNTGRYAYLCAQHRAEKVADRRELAAAGYAPKVLELLAIAKRIDKIREKALPLAQELSVAKDDWARAVEALPA